MDFSLISVFYGNLYFYLPKKCSVSKVTNVQFCKEAFFKDLEIEEINSVARTRQMPKNKYNVFPAKTITTHL